MNQLNPLETSLVKANKDLPKLPKGFTDFLVQIAPWVTLLGGIFSIYSAYVIWKWAHLSNGLVDYANSISQLYGGEAVADERLTVMLWVGMAVLGVMGVIYLMAFSPLKEKKKKGWDLLFLATIVNIVYGVVMLFSDYSYGGGIVGTVLGALIGWYFLFQIRDYYTGSVKVDAPKTTK